MKKMMFNDRYGLTQAVLEGRKTMTRRLCNFKAPDDEIKKILNHNREYLISQAPYKVGEIVAVAHSYEKVFREFMEGEYVDDRYAAFKDAPVTDTAGWCNKMFVRADLMPHQIRIISIRAERLQDITDEDCLREGIIKYTKDKTVYKYDLDDGFEMFPWRDMKRTPQEAFSALIDKINGRGTWESNPWVWVYEFELVK